MTIHVQCCQLGQLTWTLVLKKFTGVSVMEACITHMTNLSYSDSSPHKANTGIHHKSYCWEKLTWSHWCHVAQTFRHTKTCLLGRIFQGPRSWLRTSPEDQPLFAVCRVKGTHTCWVHSVCTTGIPLSSLTVPTATSSFQASLGVILDSSLPPLSHIKSIVNFVSATYIIYSEFQPLLPTLLQAISMHPPRLLQQPPT